MAEEFNGEIIDNIRKLIEETSARTQSQIEELKTEMSSFKTEINNSIGEMKQFINSELTNFSENFEKKQAQRLSDELAKHTKTMNFIKQNIRDHIDWFRPERPFTHETVIPRSISSYAVREVPAQPWDPPQPVER